MKCQMIRCPGRQRGKQFNSQNEAAVDVNENIDDGSYPAHICQACADILELKQDQYMPEPFEVDRLYNEAMRNARKKRSTRC